MFKRGGIIVAILALLLSCDNSSTESNSNVKAIDSAAVEVVKNPDIYLFGIRANDFKVIEEKVQKGQTFGEILLKQNIGYPTIHKLVGKSKGIYNTRKIQQNKNYTLLCKNDSLSTAEIMIYQPNKVDYIVFDLRDSLNVYRGKKVVENREREVSGIITSNLSVALSDQGIDYRVSNSLSEIYAWTVDFFRLQKGDYFKIVFDEKYIDDSTYVGIGPIKAAEFHNNGQSFYSFYFEKSEHPEYFDEKGRSLRKAFLKAPLKFGTFRISSRYSGRRFHPVQHRWKAHLGTDYAAPTGTPIISTANGTVIKSAYTRANGNYVKVKHNSTYSTQYLHMSKRAVRAGQTVKQGQVIGYVGMTGLATGPHVCYRFWKNGKQVDGQKQKLPDVKPLQGEIKDVYLEEIKPMRTRLDNISLPLKFDPEKVQEGEVLTSDD